MAQTERQIMAEGAQGPGLEGVQGESQIGSAGDEEKIGSVTLQASQAAIQQEQNSALTEELLKLPMQQRWKHVLTLPKSEQENAIKTLGLEIAGGAPTPDWLKEEAEGKSAFQEANDVVELASKLSEAQRTRVATKHPEFTNLLKESKKVRNMILGIGDTNLEGITESEEIKRRQELRRRQGLRDKVLTFVRDDIERIYHEAIPRPAPTKTDSDSWYGYTPNPKTLEERLNDVHKSLDNYQETFWDYGETTLRRVFGDEDIQEIRGEYGGVAGYIAAKVAIAIDKELKGRSLEPGIEIGDFYLERVKADLEKRSEKDNRDRRESRKRATADERLHYNNWREKFDFTWAETAEELDDSVEDWLDYFQQQLPLEAEEAVYQEVQKGMTNALASLEQARNRIGLEANSVIAHRLREKIVGHVTTIAGARMLESKGGFEYYIKLKTDFAANYNGYYDGIYLKKGFAIMGDKLSEDEGAIYKGGPENLKKPLAGNTKTFRGDVERNAIRYGVTHELYITDEDFDKAEMATDEDKIRIKSEIEELSLSEKESNERYIQEVQKFNRRYGWGDDDDIEDLLLREDTKGSERAEALLGEYKGLTEEQVRDRKIKEYVDSFRSEIEQLHLPPNQARDRLRQKLEEKRADINRSITRALSDRKKGLEERDKAVARIKLRTGVFKNIKKMLDKEDITEEEKKAGETKGLFGLNPDQRKARIRQRIITKIMTEDNDFLLEEINNLPDQESRDRALWKWVEEYNRRRIEFRKEGSADEPWYPSLWDMERLSITKPEDLIDRVLSKDEFKAMIEEVDDPYKGLTNKQIPGRIVEEFRRQAQSEIEAKNLSLEDAAKEFTKLMQGRQKDIDYKIEDVLFKRKQREARTIRNYNLNIAQDKFLELQARWGGLTTRVINEEGEVELRTIYSLAEEIIKAKIDKEEADIKAKVNAWKPTYLARYPNITAEELEKSTIEQERLFRRHATFAATLGLREIGIANDLPIWEYFYYGDVAEIGAFAPLVGYTDDDKGELPALLDAGRREMEAVFNFLAQQHLEDKILDVRDMPGLLIEDADGKKSEAHEERMVRARVINEGGVLKLRDIFEARQMISTSGGVEVVNLIAKIADLGVYDELWEHGCKDKREWQGFRKRRNKWELRQQSFFNIREWASPLTHVQRLVGAANARKFLVGGEIQGQGYVPGVLIEPMSGAYKYRDEFFDPKTWVDQRIKDQISSRFTEKGKEQIYQILEKDENIKEIDPIYRDKLVEIGAGIMKPVIDYMNARRYVMNRAGLAPKNWKYDNELIINAYFEELLKRPPAGSDTLGDENLGYAVQGRSPIAVKVFQDILKTSTYHILIQKDREVLGQRARKVKEKMKVKRDEIVARSLPEDVRKKLTNREAKLRAMRTSPENIAKEIQRIKDQYYDTQLHKEFVGEWPARLFGIE